MDELSAKEFLAVAHEGAKKPLIAIDIRTGNVGRQGVMWVETTTALAALADALTALQAREATLIRVGSALVAKLDECEPYISSAGVFMHTHGINYSGPQYGEALEALREVLATSDLAED